MFEPLWTRTASQTKWISYCYLSIRSWLDYLVTRIKTCFHFLCFFFTAIKTEWPVLCSINPLLSWEHWWSFHVRSFRKYRTQHSLFYCRYTILYSNFGLVELSDWPTDRPPTDPRTHQLTDWLRDPPSDWPVDRQGRQTQRQLTDRQRLPDWLMAHCYGEWSTYFGIFNLKCGIHYNLVMFLWQKLHEGEDFYREKLPRLCQSPRWD